MASHTEIEAAETISRETVAATLENHGFWLVELHARFYNGLEDALVRSVVDAVTEGKVDRVMFALTNANVAEFTGSREELAIFVKGNGHDTVGSVESFLDAITMVNIDINVENALIIAKEFQDSKYDI